MIGRKRSSAAFLIDCSGDRCSSRSAAIAKSTIMMPFFLTMPISKNDADQRDQAEVVAESHQDRERADARGGKVDRIVSGWM